MQVNAHPYAFYLAISSLISLFTAVIAWRRSAPGVRVLSLLLLAMGVWSCGYAISWLDISPTAMLLGLRGMYAGVVAVPILYFMFVLKFTHQEKWLTRTHIVLFAAVPVISLLLQWTNQYHHLIYRSIELVKIDGVSVIQFERGPWYYVNTVYSYLIILSALLALLIGTLRTSPLLRSRYYLLILASSIPSIASLYSEINFTSTIGLDLAPVSFGISGIFFVYSVVRSRLMDLIPVARSRLIENMSDGVLVADAMGRIVDINPAMLNILKGKPSSYIGRNVSEILDNWSDRKEIIWEDQDTRTELRLRHDPSRYMDLRMTPLYDEHNRLSGRIIVSRDITDRKQVEKDLLFANDRLHTQLIEIRLLQEQLREQAIRDPLTDLFNRRYLDETLERELARAEREKYPLCIVMMDLDHFKTVNDVYGHEAGDVVLKSLAEKVMEQCRHGDFACRYGGEEFVLVMPNICIESTSKRARDLHQNIEKMNIAYGRFHLSVTTSMGIACYPAHGTTKEELLRAADKALYRSKHSGRNCVSVYETSRVSDK